MKRSSVNKARQVLITLLFVTMLGTSGCISFSRSGRQEGYHDLTAEEMKSIDDVLLRELQFFTSSTLNLEKEKEATGEKISAEDGGLIRFLTEQRKSMEIPARTPGVLSEWGNDWIDLDLGENLVLRFADTGIDGRFYCVAVNGQPIRTGFKTTMMNHIEYDGEYYIVRSERPIHLQFYVRQVSQVERENYTVRGKKIEEPTDWEITDSERIVLNLKQVNN